MQGFAFVLVEFNEDPVGLSLKTVYVPLQDSPILQYIQCFLQSGIICKLDESARHHLNDLRITDKSVK